eukprot:6206303-Pleurochrysis_carterae.AAC.1
MHLKSGKIDPSNLASSKRTVNEITAAAVVNAKVNAFRNLRCKLAWLLCFAAKVTGCASEEERPELVRVRLHAGLHLAGCLVRDSGSASIV